MKILLVNPAEKIHLQGNNPRVIDKERGKNPPLGLLYVASAINKEARHQVRVVDANLYDYDRGQLVSLFREEQNDVLGVTITTFTLLDALETIKAFKEAKPKGKVIAGGPHVAIFPNETVGSALVDVAVKREGEPVINEILDHLFDSDSLRNVRGICFDHDGEVIDTGEAPYINDLDSLGIPDRTLLPFQRYYSLLGGDDYSTTLFTSRGCPYRCAFCDRPALGKKFRFHSASYVISEILHCVDLGIREFLVYDDTFTVSRNRVLEICKRIMELGLNISWDIRARVDTVDEQILRALKKAGCRAVHYGVEAGSERILERLNKGITIPRVKEVFRLTRRVGMDTLAYFMIGNPGERREDIEKSLALANQLNPDFLHMTVFTPFPATRLYQEGLESGIIPSDVWREFAADPKPDFIPPIWPENFTREELQKIVADSYKRFYLRPRYLVRRLMRLRSLAEFKRKAKAGLSVLRMERL
jgi:anaerobic magnesium-protoporphyrin IX monomethyl ester cyclase